MSFDYAASAATALRLLKQFGCSVTHNSTQATYDPATSEAQQDVAAQNGTGVLLDYTTQEAGQRQDGQSLIQVGDKKFLLATDGIKYPPVTNDTIDVGEDTYTVIRAKTLAPAGTAVLYECQLRK